MRNLCTAQLQHHDGNWLVSYFHPTSKAFSWKLFVLSIIRLPTLVQLKNIPYKCAVVEQKRSIEGGQIDITCRSSIKCNLAKVGKGFTVCSALPFHAAGNGGPTKHQILKQHCMKLQKVKHRKPQNIFSDCFQRPQCNTVQYNVVKKCH